MASVDNTTQSWGAGANLTFPSFGPPIDRCKNEHPRQGFSSGNRFGALSGGGFGGPSQQGPKYSVNATDIKADLTPGNNLPEWVFSCYGPGRNAPRQLFGGPQREQSFEELRLRHYELAAQGNMEQAVQEAQALYAECLNQNEVILKDLDGAVKYVIDGEKEHPNRIDVAEGKTGPGAGFGQPAAQPSQPPSSFGQPSAFGQSSFGQPSAPAQGSSFGQPSALGQGPSFGQPSAPAQAGGFGQPSTLGAQQPTFGQSAFSKPAFGQPSAPAQGSGFGQPSALGQAGGFGQPSTLGAQQPSFGMPSALNPGPFGNPSNQAISAQMNQPQQAQGFGQPSGQQGVSPFAQPSAQPVAPTGFGQPSQPAQNPFGQPTQQQGPFSQGFGAPTQQQQQPQQASGFGQPAPASQLEPPQDGKRHPFIKIDNPNELNPLPYMTGQTVRDPMTNKLTSWKGQPVQYFDDWPCYLHPQDGKTFVRINFPDGPPDPATLRDAQGKPEEYTPEINEQWDYFFTNGCFKDGVIPAVPPKSEWLSFDF